MSNLSESEAEVQYTLTLQPAAKKARVEQQTNDQMNAAQDFYHEIQEVLGEEKKQEFEILMLSWKQKEISDAAVLVQKATEILEGNSKLLLSFDLFLPNKLKQTSSSYSKKLRSSNRINSKNLQEKDEELQVQPESTIKVVSDIGTVGPVVDGRSSKPPEEISRGYCCVLGLSFPRRLRSGMTRNSRTIEHTNPSKDVLVQDVPLPINTKEELDEIDRIQENLIRMFSRHRGK